MRQVTMEAMESLLLRYKGRYTTVVSPAARPAPPPLAPLLTCPPSTGGRGRPFGR